MRSRGLATWDIADSIVTKLADATPWVDRVHHTDSEISARYNYGDGRTTQVTILIRVEGETL